VAAEHRFEGLYEVAAYHVEPLADVERAARTAQRTPYSIELVFGTVKGEFRFAVNRDQAHWLAEQLERESVAA
jgi:hypothetical protein